VLMLGFLLDSHLWMVSRLRFQALDSSRFQLCRFLRPFNHSMQSWFDSFENGFRRNHESHNSVPWLSQLWCLFFPAELHKEIRQHLKREASIGSSIVCDCPRET
jgi:hypothetical protein